MDTPAKLSLFATYRDRHGKTLYCHYRNFAQWFDYINEPTDAILDGRLMQQVHRIGVKEIHEISKK
jgi:hypothetical protein